MKRCDFVETRIPRNDYGTIMGDTNLCIKYSSTEWLRNNDRRYKSVN